MNGLMLHCGGQLASRADVFSVPTPQATTACASLAYESFLLRIEKQPAVEDIKVTGERLALAKNGLRVRCWQGSPVCAAAS